MSSRANQLQSYHNRKPIWPFVLTWQRYNTKQVPIAICETPFSLLPVCYCCSVYFPLTFPLAISLQVSISIFNHSFINAFFLHTSMNGHWFLFILSQKSFHFYLFFPSWILSPFQICFANFFQILERIQIRYWKQK